MTFNANRRLAFALWAGIALLFAVVAWSYAFETAMHFSGSAIDGPFQLYNSLRRIQAGFHPGVDFQFFHGMGIPYIHYWLYRMFGGGLRGSELARELLTTTIYPIVYLIVFRLFTRDWIKAVCLTGAAIALGYLLYLSPVTFALNGMLGLRSTLPTLLPAILFVIDDRRRRSLAAGALIGLSLWISTEQGLAFALAYLIVSAITMIRDRAWRARSIEVGAAIGLAVVVLLLLEITVGGLAGMRGALHYNFKLVPMDQYWYFGAPPNRFASSWHDVFRFLFGMSEVGIAVAGVLAGSIFYIVRGWRERDADDRRRLDAFALACVYALVSCTSLLGVFTPAYVQPARRVLLIIVLIEGIRFAARLDGRRGARELLGVPRGVAVAGIALAVSTVLALPFVRATLVISVPHIIVDHWFGPTTFGLDEIWPETLTDGQKVIDAHRNAEGTPPTLWSTYAGWVEARNGLFQPSVDYIIHALGPGGRERYTADFVAKKPTLVQTVRPTYTQYEPWIENNHWDFYDALLQSYRVTAATPWSFYWDRRPTPLPPPRLVARLPVAPGAPAVTFTIPPGGPPMQLLEVQIDYRTRNALGALPVIGMTPRYLVGIGGAFGQPAISLAPYDTTKRFPLLARGGATITLSFGTFALFPGASWEPHVIRILVPELDAGSSAWLEDLVVRTAKPPTPQL